MSEIKQREDADKLLNITLELAKELLFKNKEFYPFGASIDNQNEASIDSAYEGTDNPPSQDLIDLLNQSYLARNDLRAAAICADVKLNGSDAIRVSIETESKDAIDLFLPYKRTRKGFVYGELSAGQREATFLAAK